MVDSSLIKLLKTNKNAAFKEMYQKCIGYVYTVVKRYVTNESERKDVIQEIFAKMFLSIGSFDESKGDFKYWLRRLVINQCLQHYRQGKSPKAFVSLEAVTELGNEEDHYLHELSKAEIEKSLHEMPEGYRQIFLLVIIDEYSHKEVGEMLGITAETSRSQLSRAKNWFRKKNLKYNEQKKLNFGI